MKPAYTIVMLLIVIALGTYVYIFEQDPVKTEDDIKSEKLTFLTFEEAQLEELHIEQSSQTLSLKRTKDGWEMTKPEASPAEKSKVDSSINQIKSWKAWQTVMTDFNDNQKADFGLDVPFMTVKVKLKGESVLKEFLVGNKTPTNNGYYLLPKGEKTLYIVYSHVPDSLAKLVKEPPKPTPTPKPTATPTPAASASSDAKATPETKGSPESKATVTPDEDKATPAAKSTPETKSSPEAKNTPAAKASPVTSGSPAAAKQGHSHEH